MALILRMSLSRTSCFRTGAIRSDLGDLTLCLCVRERAHRPQQTPTHTPYAHSSHSRMFASKASEIPGETILRVAFQFPVQPFLRLDHCLSRITRITNVNDFELASKQALAVLSIREALLVSISISRPK